MTKGTTRGDRKSELLFQAVLKQSYVEAAFLIKYVPYGACNWNSLIARILAAEGQKNDAAKWSVKIKKGLLVLNDIDRRDNALFIGVVWRRQKVEKGLRDSWIEEGDRGNGAVKYFRKSDSPFEEGFVKHNVAAL